MEEQTEPTPSQAPAAVEVTAGDREAAWNWINRTLDGEVHAADHPALAEAFARYRAALTRPSPTAEGVEAISWVAVLREWFGGERYARDYEYLDANYRKQAERVATYVAATLPSSPSPAPASAGEVERRELLAKMDWVWPAFHDVLAKMRAAMEAHPFWHKAVGTPLETDLPVRAAEVALAALSTTREGEAAGAEGWQHVSTAPKDSTILELVVDYSDGRGPLQDAVRACTIGWNELGDTGEDKWHIVGWDWTHDYIRAGKGEVLAWRTSRLMACDDSLPPLAACPAPTKGEG